MHMPKRALYKATLILLLTAYSSVLIVNAAAQEAPGPVTIVNFDVPVDPGSSAFVQRAINYAISQNASAIIFQMNTPGGLLSDMLSIVTTITDAEQAGIPAYTFVVPNGLAASAGSYIAMATQKIFMAPGSEIGPSTPIVVGGTALEQNHTEAAMLKEMESLAQKWGRNVTAAADMVLYDEAFSYDNALRVNIADGISNSLSDMLTTLNLSGRPQAVLDESYYEQFISALSNPTLDGILMLVGIVAIVLDIYHPTIFLSVAGAIAIILGLIGAEVVNASILGYAIIAIAAAFIVLELKLGHGYAMMIGVGIGGLGIFVLSMGLNYSPSPITDITELELFLVVVFGVIAGLYFRWIIGPIIRRRKLTGPEALEGKIGVAVTDLDPNGEVRVAGVVWRAISASEYIKKGEQVKVKYMKNLMVTVEKLAEESEGTSN
jgi:membrane-bound serine protease (ClpP class)